ncbi:Fatty acyl-CoA synthetase and RNA processing-associated kinase 1 [Choanephora cucurbitarum]|uniref:non-specific serine/threonine protein kinase n=1 Tax=Choanephora cucurbitarum TaxID=101091 RepID=A0A1C7NMU6_9FUNG|nr:Fatty acyl-CoA synthetase and RNA processing-associated kinase 1 [Choanephora cucurbitarum]
MATQVNQSNMTMATPVSPHQRAYSVMAIPSELEQHRHNKRHQHNNRTNHPDLSWHQEIYKKYGYEPKHKNPSYFGPYLLLQTLGEGEFAKVKAGVHVHTNQEVAIKLMRKDLIKHASLETKLEREISVLRSVHHPYIVQLFDVLTIKNYIGIVLQRAAGGELFDYILKHHYLQESEAKRLFAQLISGVHYMHQKHIVHRDLKLENLLLSKDRNILITDFGFANRFQMAQEDLMVTSCGSPCYAAPELVINDDSHYVGTAVDIWSCGVILFAMLCGYLPFDDDPSNPQGANINALYKYIVSTPLEIPSTMSVDATHLLRRMLVPDPAKRCTMDEIRSHPWLSDHWELLNMSIEELEQQMNHMPTSDPQPAVAEQNQNATTVTAESDVEPVSIDKEPVPELSSVVENEKTEQETDETPQFSEKAVIQPVCTTVQEDDEIPSLEVKQVSLDDEKHAEITQEQPKTIVEQEKLQPTSFLHDKFLKLQRRVSTNSHSSSSVSSRKQTPHVTLNDQIPDRSQSFQPQKTRRERTVSEYYTTTAQQAAARNGRKNSLKVVPSVSEQYVVSGSNTHKAKTKGQKLIDWFKRKPSQSTKFPRSNAANQNKLSTAESSDRFPLHERPISALPNPIRAMPIGKPLGSYAADFNDSRLRLHKGAVDQDALTSKAPNEVLQTITESLNMMGIDMKKSHDFKIKCVRPARQQSTYQRTRKISAVPFKLFFHPNTTQQQQQQQRQNKPSQRSHPVQEKKANVLYGEQGIDSGDEVQFTVELSKIENLPGLYVVDIRRTRGNIWAFKFLYHTLLDLLNLSGQSGMGYMAHRRVSDAEIKQQKQAEQQKNRISYMTTSSSGSSMMVFEEPIPHK